MISAKAVANMIHNGVGVIICGNGGSMAQAQHLAAEVVGLGYPVMALSDPAVLSALNNDDGALIALQTWVRAFAGRFELFIGLTTSGSANVMWAAAAAAESDMKVIMITGERVMVPNFADLHIKFEGDTQEIQEHTLEWIHSLYARLKELKTCKSTILQ